MRNKTSFTLALVFLSVSAVADVPGNTTFQTRIVAPSGAPLEAASVNFRFTILDSAGTCAIYVEDYNNVSMVGTQGVLSFSLGSGSKQYPPTATKLSDVFNNSTASFPCQAGGTFSPGITDRRQIVMQFNDGSGWQTLPQAAIQSVPYAQYANRAESLGDYPAANYLRPTTLPTCTGSQAINWDGTTFTCVTASGGGGGGVSSVSGTAPISVATGSSTPVISIAKATSSTNGYLSSADWTAFNAKANSVVGAGKLYLGNASGDATGVTLSGDATLATSGVMTLANSGVTAGTYGSANAVPSFTVDAKGRITSASSNAYQYATSVDKGVVQIGSNLTISSGVLSMLSSDITNALGYLPAGTTGSSAAFINGGNSVSADATLGTNSNYSLNINTNNLTRIRVANDGKVGIGTGTATPATALEVAGPSTFDSWGTFKDFVTAGGVSDGNISSSFVSANYGPSVNTGSRISFETYNTGYSNVVQTSALTSVLTANTVGSEKADLYFSTLTGGADSEKMRIKDNGYVGIGTSTPNSTLNVVGSIVSKSVSGSTANINFATGNVQMSSTSATTINICGLTDGGSYTLVLTGITANTTVTIAAYAASNCTGTAPQVDLSGGQATFTSGGNTNIISFVYFSGRGANGTVYGFPATNYNY